MAYDGLWRPIPVKLVTVTEIYAHRGLHVVERENTIGAFLAAKAAGVYGVELDVRRTADGELVVHHDPTIDGLVIANTLRRELPAYVPTLVEVLDVSAGLHVNVEIKNIQHSSEPTYDPTGGFARQVVQTLDDVNWGDSVIISCFDLATCAFVRSFDTDIPIAVLVWDLDLRSVMTQAHVLELNAVNPYFSTVTSEIMEIARDLVLDVNPWTVNDPLDIKAMAELGVRGIITDDPVGAMAVVG